MDIKAGKLRLLLVLSLLAPLLELWSMNGFDLDDSLIDRDLILSGGPPRDGIPSIDQPRFLNPEDIKIMKDDDMVLSFTHNNQVRAYPLRILVWHEVVNDEINNLSFSVTYCPLCGTAMVFDREYDGRILSFGVSGLLYNSDVLLYDRETESLWTQIGMQAISGSMKETAMKWFSSEMMTWETWLKTYPEGQVLSQNTGFQRNYRGTAYRGYDKKPDTYFPYQHEDTMKLPAKAWVAGVIIDGIAKAYPLGILPDRMVKDRVGLVDIEFKYDKPSRRMIMKRKSDANELPFVYTYYFAWNAFYPDTQIWARY